MHEKFMKEAIKEAKKAKNIDEVPIGAVIVYEGKIIARAHNKRETNQLATSHAEILVIEKACKKLNSWRLEGCSLYVTLEPCPMCAGATVLSRLDNVIFGANDPKGGSFGTCFNLNQVPGLNHYPVIIKGILEDKCAQLLKDFFKEKRISKKASSVAES